MQRFLDAYGADGGVEVRQPDGSSIDLIVFLHPDDDPIFVQFSSRIREARHRGRPTIDDDDDRLGDTEPTDQVEANRAAELGAVVSLLASADTRVLRRIRRMLENELD
jgi:hypothetical protein